MRRWYVPLVLIFSCIVTKLDAQNAISFRLVEVKVVDSNGEPLDQATVEVTASDLDFPLAVDNEGIATLNLPSDATNLSLKASCPGHVPLEVHWQQENIPDTFTFAMSKGQPIGGIVHDEWGKPIEGVTVEGLLVSSQAAADGVVLPHVGGELGKTDANGSWRADIATKEPLELRLKLTHEKYFSDTSFGKRRVSNDELRSLTHVEFLQDRVPPQGTVRDAMGEPAENAALYVLKAGETVTLDNGAPHSGHIVGKIDGAPPQAICESDAAGKFEFPHQKNDFTLLCLAAEGWQIVPAKQFAKNEPVDITLTAWARVEGVLTQEGKALAGQKLQLAVHGDDLSTDVGQVLWNNFATTNEKGEFVFERATNGFASLGAEMEYCGGAKHQRHDFSIEAQTSLQPGKAASVVVNREGLNVTGTIVPLRYDGSEAGIVCGMIALEKEDEAADFVNKVFFEWGRSATVGLNFDPVRNAMRLKSPPKPHYLARVDAEGRFRFECLPPGKYRARISIRAEATDELDEAWLAGNIWEAFPIAAPADAKEKSVKLGLLEFEVYESGEK